MHLVSKTPDMELTERAQSAVAAFRTMQHSLTSYARAITGNPKVRVEVSSGPPMTDGTIIYYRPPIALGDRTPHDRFMCDKRALETGLLICAACRVREEVLVNIYHEIAHIAYDTFAGGVNFIVKARDEGGAFWPAIFNTIEDSRVDGSMFEARKGMRKMFQADTYNLLREGVPAADGTNVSYTEMPLNHQITLGLYLAATGYIGWQEYLHEKVGADIADASIQHLIGQLRKTQSSAQVYELIAPVYNRLRELGYFMSPEEQEQQEQEHQDEPEPEPESGDSDESESGGVGGSPSDDQSESGEEGGEPSDSSPAPGADEEQSSDGAGSSEDSSIPEDNGDGTSNEASSDSEAEDEGEESNRDAGQDSKDDASMESDGGRSDSGSEPTDSDGEGDAEESPSTESSQGKSTDSSDGEVDDSDSDGVPEGTPEAGSGESDGLDAGDAESEASESVDQSSSQSSPDAEPTDSGGSDSEGSLRGDGSSGEGDDSGGATANPQGDDGDQLDEQPSSEREGEGSDSPEAGSPEGDPNDSEEGDTDLSDTPSERESESGDRPDVIDSGADEGKGGIKVEDNPLPEQGSAEDAAAAIDAIHGHDDDKEAAIHGTPEEQRAILVAIIQGMYFETPSWGVATVYEHEYAPDAYGWDSSGISEDNKFAFGTTCDMDISEKILGPALLKTRRIFSDNETAAYENNLRSGRINTRSLGTRAWKGDDDRLFAKKRLPGRQDYAVLLMLDISSSNRGDNIARVKRAVFAQAELCARVGVKFAIVAHSASSEQTGNTPQQRSFVMHLHHVKKWDEPWSSEMKNRVGTLAAVGGNLDGHAMEFGRKYLGRIQATDKIMLYYTDGKMPAANAEEELEVLQRQLKLCKKDRITLLGVGIQTDSPTRHGLETVRVDSDEDLAGVVNHLGKRLGRAAR